jgi:hypothetical protein
MAPFVIIWFAAVAVCITFPVCNYLWWILDFPHVIQRRVCIFAAISEDGFLGVDAGSLTIDILTVTFIVCVGALLMRFMRRLPGPPFG